MGDEVLAVSSTRVRELLSVGDLSTVASLLDRPHRVVLNTDEAVAQQADGDRGVDMETSGFSAEYSKRALRWLLPRSALLNQPPCNGRYACVAFIHEDDEETEDAQVLRETRVGSGFVDVAEGGLRVVLEASPIVGGGLTLKRWSCLSLELVQ